MPHQEIVLFHRTPAQQIVAVRPFLALEWSRRFRGSGLFRADLSLTDGAPVAVGDLLDIELDGRAEFTGIVQLRSLAYRPDREPLWRLEGMDLTWWLHQRVIVPPSGLSHDEQIGVAAEAALRHYIDGHLLNPTDAARKIPLPALLEPAHAPLLGPIVTVRARYTRLAKQIESIAALADLGYAAGRDADGRILFRVLATRDRTAASANPVIFSPNLGTVEEMIFTEDGAGNHNALYVLGAGTGVTRLVQSVLDSPDISAHARRELALDARDADTAAAATDAGKAELARQAALRLRFTALPPHLGPHAYRRDWDVGDLVTLDLPDLGLRVDQRLESLRAEIDSREPLRLSCAFGAPPPDAAAALRQIDNRTTPGRYE